MLFLSAAFPFSGGYTPVESFSTAATVGSVGIDHALIYDSLRVSSHERNI